MKIKTQYVCQSCGTANSKWLGKCPGCGEWNTLIEEKKMPESGAAGRVSADRGTVRSAGAVRLGSAEIPTESRTRLATGISELDRTLGGGLVRDSFVLLGGDPGIGKSTLLLQMAEGLCRKNPELSLLYVSGEESVEQIHSRALRLGLPRDIPLDLASETLLENAIALVDELKPQVLVIDSLQTFASSALESAPGSVSQVREIALRLMSLAKTRSIAVWLVGHVTKEGSLAGPKAVEHMVDTVLYFEAEAGQSYRLLRTVKNRFGSTHELGVFEMDGEGLKEVANPSSLFLSERKQAVPGTAIAASLEGSRPILVELQALVTPTSLAMPRRTAVGMDSSRIALLSAILEKHMRLNLGQQDLFFNVAGGLKLSEPACDLAAAAAIWSSAREQALPLDWIFLGELGLTGEVRRVAQLEVRVEEAKKLGFRTFVLPESALAGTSLGKSLGKSARTISRIEELSRLLGVSSASSPRISPNKREHIEAIDAPLS